jgi:ubiquilin
MEDAKIKIVVRQSSGDQFDIEIGAKATVMELKEECAKKQEAMAAGEMRLIFKGKILKDEMTLDEYKITDGMTIHLVKGKAAGGQPAAATASDAGASTTASNAGAGAAGAGIGLGAGA